MPSAVQSSSRRRCPARFGSISSILKDDLDWFTHTQRLVEAGDLQSLSVDDLHRYRTLGGAISQRIAAFTAGPLLLHRQR